MHANKVAVVKESSGNAISEYALTSGLFALGIDTNPNGYLYVTDGAKDGGGGVNPGRIAKISTSGSVTSSATAVPLYEISSDSTGNIWYTTASTGNPSVVKVTPGGTVTNFSTLTTHAVVYEVTEGPPGTGMWFTEEGSGKIGNITAGGSVVEYTVPTTGSAPLGIVAACGNLWFTESGKSKIGELTPSGTFTEYTIPTASSDPTRMTVDANGNVWFVESAGNKIAMITTATSAVPDASIYVLNSTGGSILNYASGTLSPPPTATITSLPGAGASTNGTMAFDPSGNLWVTDGWDVASYAPGAAGSATPLSTFIPADTTGHGIAVDAEGEILLTSSSNAISAYAAGSSGSATPIRTISGSSTNLNGPYRMVVDGSDNLWVINVTGVSVEEFPASANGNVAPSLYLDSTWASNNGISDLESLGFDASGDLVVLANDGENVFTFAAGVSESSHYTTEFNTQELNDMALDDHGYLYGAASSPGLGAIQIYSLASTGTATPYATISGSSGGFDDPIAMATWSGPGRWYGGDARHAHRGKHKPLR
jgi:virginiamycin B lyase